MTAVFNNPADREDTFFYRVEISTSDVDLLFFTLVNISILPNAFHPVQEAVCGIIVVNILGLTGSQISTIALSLSFLGIGVGLGVWQPETSRLDRNAKPAMQTLGVVVLLAVVVGVMGWWVIAIALAVTTILLLISLRFAFA